MNRSTNTPLFGVFHFGFIVMETRTEMWLAVESGRKVSPDFTDTIHHSIVLRVNPEVESQTQKFEKHRGVKLLGQTLMLSLEYTAMT